jgi:protein-disulfide isomerase
LGRALAEAPSAAAALIPRSNAPMAWLFWGIVLTGTAGSLAVHASTTFLAQGPPGTLRKQMTNFVSQQNRVSVQTSGDPQQGPDNAAIRVVEFSDFLCPSCQRAFKFNPVVFASRRRELSFIFKHFPLEMECNSAVNRNVHPGACKIAAATECAHEQGKFWPLHDLIFEKQQPRDKTHAYQLSDLEADAARAGLDVPQFQACMESGRGMAAVRRDVAEAVRLGVSSTPTFVVNGVLITGTLTPAAFEELVNATRR